MIRPLYAQTQATPYAAVLHPSLRNPTTQDYDLSAYTATLYKGGLVPGTVMMAEGEAVKPATGAANERPFGLLANFVGGELDDLGDENFVGVWRGPDAVFEILAPGFDDASIPISPAAGSGTPGAPLPLIAGPGGKLTGAVTPGANVFVVAHLVERPNTNRIIVDLRV